MPTSHHPDYMVLETVSRLEEPHVANIHLLWCIHAVHMAYILDTRRARGLYFKARFTFRHGSCKTPLRLRFGINTLVSFGRIIRC
jgi:hypothetical protein